VDFFNWLGEKFSDLADKLINALPSSPIVWLQANSEINKYMSYVNWFIPVYTFIGMMEVWLTAVVIYYVVQVILRWAKIVE